MSDIHDADADALDEGALLAAYLDGHTDDVTTRRLERRLAADADLAARLDAIAETRAMLQRLERVTAPDDVRQRLGQHLAQQRSESAPGTVQPPRRRTAMRLAPLAAAAGIVLVAVLGVAALLPLLSGGSEESAVQSADGVGRAAAESGGGRTGDDELQAAEEEPEAEAGGSAPQALSGAAADSAGTASSEPAPVRRDADIAARVERLLDDPPADLPRREQQLRRGAGLPPEPTCVSDLDASTVDLITQDGRTSLAVLVGDGAGQIVLIDPSTCAPIRTISRD